jgi:hypothetical protein
MHRLAIVLGALAIVLTAPATARAADCTEEERVEVVVWTAINWNRVGRAFANDPAPCAEYWISIPPGTNRINLRSADTFDQVSALGPNIHPMAEMVLGTNSGWQAPGTTRASSSGRRWWWPAWT